MDFTMFRKHTKHLQETLFGFRNDLPKKQQQELDTSEESKFYELIFCNINEEDFACLYSEADSRPNAPVNALVSSLILMQKRSYTYEEFFKNLHFNLLTKTAFGLQQIDEIPFCPATLFNFQNRLSKYHTETDENLLEKAFDNLTLDQIKELKIKTDIQRTDSFFAASNIRNYTRLQLFVEVLIRLSRILDDTDYAYFKELLKPYVKNTSDNYIYKLKASDIPHHLEKIGAVYFRLYEQLRTKYSEDPVFNIFERVYKEHFMVKNKKVTVKSSDELTSNSLQSPDDIDATYRDKNGKKSKGQLINIFETAHPENPVNLINDVSVRANNVGEDKILHDRIDKVKEKTPPLDELHFDGAYGSSNNDKKLEELQITQVQTAIKGRTARVEIQIERINKNQYKVSCPYQSALSKKCRKREKSIFNLDICSTCPLSSECPTITAKKVRVYYFTKSDYLKKKRLNRINNIPKNRRKLRNNVEATVAEFTRKMPNKKLKVRGYFKTAVFAYTAAIAINFGRIFRYAAEIPKKPDNTPFTFIYFVKEQCLSLINSFKSFLFLKYYQNYLKFKSIVLNKYPFSNLAF